MMYKDLHRRVDIEIHIVSREEEGRGLTKIEDSMDALRQGLEDYIKKDKEIRITESSKTSDIIKTNMAVIKIRGTETGRKQLCIHFKQQPGKITLKKTLAWLRKEILTIETESLLMAVQNNVIKSLLFQRTFKKAVEHEGDCDSNCNWSACHSPQWVGKGNKLVGNQNKHWDHLNYSIFDNRTNTEYSPGDLRRTAVTCTPMKDNQLTRCAFDTFIKGLIQGLEDLETGRRVETIQTTAFIRLARIIIIIIIIITQHLS